MLSIRTTALLALAMSSASAAKLTIINSCSESIDLWDNRAVQVMGPGERSTRDLPVGYLGMFRAGKNPQATLAEFSVDGAMQMLWYDISIIPTGPKSGPDYCPSLQACKDHTGGVGFNKPMQIAAAGCKTRTCMADGCADAYQYPKDDLKTTACNINTPVELTFCPGGAGGQTQALMTQAPTPPPTTQKPTPPPTTQAPTPPPTTQAPTPPPTTQAPTPVPTTQAPTPPPTTQAPTPVPTTQAPTPVPTTQAPTPVPTTQAPTPVPTTQAPTPESTANELRSSSGTGSSSGSHADRSISSSDDNTALEAGFVTQAPINTDSTVASVALNPIDAPPATGGGGATNAGGSTQNISVQGPAESSSKLGMTLIMVLGAVASVAGIAVFVAAKKKKQMDASETKDSLYCEEGMLTPVNDIQCI